MDIQRLRNLTTGLLHTTISDIQEDIEFLSGEKGVMTHQIPAAYQALLPFLKKKITDPRFWDGQYDPTHTGKVDISPLNDVEKSEMWNAIC